MSLINRCLRLIKKVINCLGENGLRVTWSKVKRKISQILKYRPPLYTKKELEAQKQVTFPRNIKFSVLVPVYNTPEKYLREMIESVEAQTYANWELCIADGSDSEHSYVGDICREYASGDSRILYQKLEENMGISGNTNVCIDMASGDYISLFDHDDILHPAALYANMKAICEKDADFIYTDENTFHNTPRDAFNPHFKPDYAPDTLRANNYICHFLTVKKSLLDSVGGFRPECDGSQDYDMVLRLTEKARRIVHIPQILYYWRAHRGSVADSVGAKPYVIEAAKRAISDHLERTGLKGEAQDGVVPSMYRLKYEIEGNPLVSVVVQSSGEPKKLKACLNSVYEKTSYKNYEVIIIEKEDNLQTQLDYSNEIQNKLTDLKIVCCAETSNRSKRNNLAVAQASGEHIVFLEESAEVITADWIQEMLMYSQRKDVGAVGAKLYYSDGTIQHAGIGVGLLGLAGYYHRGDGLKSKGYMGRLTYAQNFSAVSGACLMMRRAVWNEIGGMDEAFEGMFGYLDMCMRVRKAGYLVVWTPFAELYNHIAKKADSLCGGERNRTDSQLFKERWERELAAGDPYYNPNLTLKKEDLSEK